MLDRHYAGRGIVLGPAVGMRGGREGASRASSGPRLRRVAMGRYQRYRGEMQWKSAGEAPEVPSYGVCGATELQKCRRAESKCVCCCCCFSLIHEKKNMTTLVQLVLQELIPGPFCPVAARLALFSSSSSGSSSSAGVGSQGALSSSRELCPSRSERNVSIGGSARRRRGKGCKQCSGAEA